MDLLNLPRPPRWLRAPLGTAAAGLPEWLRLARRPGMRQWQRTRFAVVDIETTGLDDRVDRIVSVAVVPVSGGRVRSAEARQWMVDPGIPIPVEATAVHGLTDRDVVGLPGLQSLAWQIAASVAPGDVLVGHNLDFDLSFLERAGIRLSDRPRMDTWRISRMLDDRADERHTLDAVAARLGIAAQDRHTALGDALTTAHCLTEQLPRLAAAGLIDARQVERAVQQDASRRAVPTPP